MRSGQRVRSQRRLLTLITVCVFVSGSAFTGQAYGYDRRPIVGQASAIDGDTIEIHGQRIRLFGIDAPEGGQRCNDAKSKSYRCGQRAAMALFNKIGRQSVACEPRDKDRYGRVVAVCRAGGVDLNGWLVAEGLAIAYRRFSNAYVLQEAAARSGKRGLWAGAFMLPEEWRRSNRK